jgi:hypothetical protein
MQRNDKAGLFKSLSKQTNGETNIVSARFGSSAPQGALALAA